MQRHGSLLIACAYLVALAITPAASASTPSTVPRYDHIFVIVEENHGFHDVIGNPAAPNLNALADRFGLATNYFGVSHPSEPNYVGLLGGNVFGVASDDAYWINTLDKPSLISQLDGAGVSWKAYLQASPYPGYEGVCYPYRCNGSPDIDPLYVSKHDAIQNYTTSRNPADWSRQVPIEQLDDDLASGRIPTFGYIIPDECHDEHGDPPYCLDSGNPFDPQDQHLVAFGDAYLGKLVAGITGAAFWPTGNNAVAIVYDEGDDNSGCCDSTPGGGQVAAIVVTNHGPRAVKDDTAYNHFSLLRTVQLSLGLGCLEFTCDVANVKPMAPLFQVTGSRAVRTRALDVPNFPTPSPTPDEPVTYTSHTESSDGWTVVPAPVVGTNDNSLGAVAAAASNDAWAVGNFLPDTPSSNQDATLSLAMHFDGTHWVSTPTPNAGPNFNTLFGVAAADRHAWAVGVHLNKGFQARGLIESWDPESNGWRVVSHPQPGSERDLLFGVAALSASDVWAVGEQQSANGMFGTLVEHFDGRRWQVVPSPNPGRSGNHLYGVLALEPDDVWAVGQRNDADNPDHELILHWDGARWKVLASASHGSASAALYGVLADRGTLWAVGETTDATAGGHPLVEHLAEFDSTPDIVQLPSAGSIWTTLWGVAASDGLAWPVGTFVNLATDNNVRLVLRGDNGRFSVVNAPNPGSKTNILSGATAVADTIWAVGHFTDDGSRQPLIERHQAP
jgi:hypothetical protein